MNNKKKRKRNKNEKKNKKRCVWKRTRNNNKERVGKKGTRTIQAQKDENGKQN
jgi:hypothetical protein